MTIDQQLKSAKHTLTQAGIGTARLDTLVLMEDVSGKDRAWLLAHPEHELTAEETAKLKKLLNKRVDNTPLAYVRGKTEFYGREFIVTPDVLEPRPESETMIDMLKTLPDLPSRPRIGDVGAGSGALGITAKLELPKTSVALLEVDPAALEVAKMNVDKFTINIPVILSDLLSNAHKTYDILLCNLPYVPDSHTINQAAMHEPKIAIFGGKDGLDIYRKLFQQIESLQIKPLYLLLESLPPQHSSLQTIANDFGYSLAQEDDFIQAFVQAS